MKEIEQTLTSIEVAKMIGREHKNLLADIRGYIQELSFLINEETGLGELKIQPTDFFKESTYVTEQNKTLPCFLVTKKGCEFIAHKMTGQKGTAFTARYINRFHDMEDVIKEGIAQKKEKFDSSNRTEIMMMNARTRMAQAYLKLAQVDTLSSKYKEILVSKASQVLSGEELIPLPKTERKVYSAGEIGDMFGVSANKIGRIANQHKLKTDEFGEFRRSKSEHSTKEVDTWVYFDSVIPALEDILDQKASSDFESIEQ